MDRMQVRYLSGAPTISSGGQVEAEDKIKSSLKREKGWGTVGGYGGTRSTSTFCLVNIFLSTYSM